MNNKQVTKLTLTVAGIQEDILSCIPDGKKAAVLNAALLESAKNGSIFGIFFEIFGVQDGQKIKKRVEKMLSGVGIDSNETQNNFRKEIPSVPENYLPQQNVEKMNVGTEIIENQPSDRDVVGDFNFNFETTGGK